MCVCVCVYIQSVTKIRTNQTISLNKMFNEKLNITKKFFTWHLRDPCRAQLFDISPINLNDGLYSRSHAHCNVALCRMLNSP